MIFDFHFYYKPTFLCVCVSRSGEGLDILHAPDCQIKSAGVRTSSAGRKKERRKKKKIFIKGTTSNLSCPSLVPGPAE